MKNLKVAVPDLSGKVVKEFGNIDSYDISSLQRGAYFVTISDGKASETKKIRNYFYN